MIVSNTAVYTAIDTHRTRYVRIATEYKTKVLPFSCPLDFNYSVTTYSLTTPQIAIWCILQYKTQMLFVTAEMTKGHLQTLSKLNSLSYSKWNRTQWGSSPACPSIER